MYTLIIDKLRVGPEQLTIDSTEFLTKLVSPEYLSLAIEIVNDINTTIIKPIIRSSTDEILLTFQSKLIPFTLKFHNLNTIILLSQQDMLKVAELDYTFYSRILELVKQTNVQIGAENTMKLTEIIERMIDYENVLLGILINRPDQLTETLKEINLEDLLTSIAGTMLALACILDMLNEQKPDSKKIEILLHIADERSEIMESYSDTIDIMSNPEEMELLKQSEQE
jgi:hypothetical protein